MDFLFQLNVVSFQIYVVRPKCSPDLTENIENVLLNSVKSLKNFFLIVKITPFKIIYFGPF